jgi:hypothetical protein
MRYALSAASTRSPKRAIWLGSVEAPDKSAVIEKAAQAIRCLEEDTTIDISSVLEDYGNGLEDPAWMFRFRDEGGLSMVSGTTTSFRSQSIL